jgi:ferredoxin
VRAVVDGEKCQGCGVCVELCPDVFEMGDDDMAKAIVDVVPAEAEDDCRDAADQCPEEAITIEE